MYVCVCVLFSLALPQVSWVASGKPLNLFGALFPLVHTGWRLRLYSICLSCLFWLQIPGGKDCLSLNKAACTWGSQLWYGLQAYITTKQHLTTSLDSKIMCQRNSWVTASLFLSCSAGAFCFYWPLTLSAGLSGGGTELRDISILSTCLEKGLKTRQLFIFFHIPTPNSYFPRLKGHTRALSCFSRMNCKRAHSQKRPEQ